MYQSSITGERKKKPLSAKEGKVGWRRKRWERVKRGRKGSKSCIRIFKVAFGIHLSAGHLALVILVTLYESIFFSLN